MQHEERSGLRPQHQAVGPAILYIGHSLQLEAQSMVSLLDRLRHWSATPSGDLRQRTPAGLPNARSYKRSELHRVRRLRLAHLELVSLFQ